MSTHKTQNYNLHSWLPQDEFHLTEINENFAALDAALKSETEELDEQMTSEVAAINAALAGKIEFIYGTYVGDGVNDRHFDLGRKPVAVIIEHCSGLRGSAAETYGNLFVQGGTYKNTQFTFEDTGFALPIAKHINNKSSNHSYIAFFE